jgi:dTDP-4-dehydrorhamnose 3,5-epimerase
VTFSETKLKGAFVLELEKQEDGRGFFALTWCEREFANHGLRPNFTHCGIAFNHKRGTLRGMHYQADPHAESKLVRCTAGSIYDVVIDLRSGSPTFTQWTAVELSARNRRVLYIPENFAHGFQTLEDNTEVSYQISNINATECGRGIRWNDPAFAIQWPDDRPILSDRDKNYADFRCVPSQRSSNCIPAGIELR